MHSIGVPSGRSRLWRFVPALFAASLGALFLSPLGHSWPFIDLEVYRAVGHGVLHGVRLYDLRFPGDLAYTYPPFPALLFAALGAASLQVEEWIATSASVVLLPTVIWLALRLRPVDPGLRRSDARALALVAAAIALWTEPVWSTLRYGQIDLAIAALVLFDLSRPDHARWKGAGIGLAAAVKLTPAIFVVYLLLTRRYRAFAVAVGSFGATVAVGYALLPHDSARFFAKVLFGPQRAGRLENAANQSIRGALARLLHTTEVHTLWLCIAAATALVGLGLAARAGRRGDEAAGFALCAVSGLLISPVSWTHHWVLLVPALAVFTLRAYRRRQRVVLAAGAGAVAVACSHMIWWVPIGQHRHAELHLDAIQLLWADAYVLCAFAALALALAAAVLGPRSAQ